MDGMNIPSVSWAVVSEGKVAGYGATGVASLQSAAPVTPDTVYEVASITKSVFAYLVNRLALAGLIELDRPLSNLLEHELFARDPRSARITPRPVLTHTTGLPNWRRHTGEFRTYFEPGMRFSYSGEGFVLLQLLAEQLLGADLDTAAREHIFEPLNMRHSTFVWPPDMPMDICVGHSVLGEPVEKPPRPGLEAAGGLHSTPLDLARFMCGLIADESVCSQMLQPGLHISDFISSRPGWPGRGAPLDAHVSWGHGIGLEESSEGVNFWQWGDNEGWKGFFVGCAEHGDGAVILTNSQAGRRIFAPFLAAVSDSTHPSLDWMERISEKPRVASADQ
jgi:CubicO group peptidase (beta-lactamase class C family)